MANILLTMENVSKTYPGVKALSNVSFSLNKGEVHALVGENGAGKSTLIKILAGVIRPDEGAIITLEGEQVVFSHPVESVRKGIAVTYQDLGLFPNLSVAENIAISREVEAGNFKVHWSHMRERAQEALDRLGVDLDIDVPLGRLSVGNQQLVAIARALVCNAKLLILDEPTSSLSSDEVNALFKIVRSLRNEGLTIMFVSHKLDEVFTISDRITILRDGEHIGTFPTTELDEPKLISLMVGREVRFDRFPAGAVGEPILEVQGLSKEGNFKEVSFTLHKGEILGITGLVGAGRTELAHALFGDNPPDSGRILLNGTEIKPGSTHEAMELGIAYIPESRQTHGLFLGKTVTDNVAVTVLHELVSRFKIVNKHKRKNLVEKWVERLNVRPSRPEMYVDNLSGGNQQKVVVAKWLAYSPKVLIVDEPTNGIDVGAKREIHQLLRELADRGIGIIVISSELAEVLAISDRILVMRRGRIAAEFAGDTATQESIMSKAIPSSNVTQRAAGEGL